MNEPAYSFPIPSLHDDVALDCRIHHPRNIANLPHGQRWKGAVIAHPYAPLGGSQDDPVVLSVTDTLLKQGHVVVTFNFRGAGDSAGRTSWTGRPEVYDFTSVVGLLIYYIQSLDVGSGAPLAVVSTDDTSGGIAVQAMEDTTTTVLNLLLGGYSFGSLILARLPPVHRIRELFEAAERGSSASEIFLRARTLAKQTLASYERSQLSSRPRGRTLDADDSPRNPQSRASPVTVGGEETNSSERRTSRDKHSVDLVREMPHRLKAHMKRLSGSIQKDSDDAPTPPTASTTNARNPVIRVTYLLISPLLIPLTSTLLPPGLPLSLTLTANQSTPTGQSTSGVLSLDCSTLMLFGATDTFTSAKRLRQWAENLTCESSGQVQWTQIEGAGHFWREKGVMRAMQTRIIAWLSERGTSGR